MAKVQRILSNELILGFTSRKDSCFIRVNLIDSQPCIFGRENLFPDTYVSVNFVLSFPGLSYFVNSFCFYLFELLFRLEINIYL